MKLCGSTVLYPLSLHDALPILNTSVAPVIPLLPTFASRIVRSQGARLILGRGLPAQPKNTSAVARTDTARIDRKSTRLNSSHLVISYAVFCLKKKTYSRY